MSFVRAGFMVAALSGLLGQVARADTTYLKCYKATDSLRIAGKGPDWLKLDALGLAEEKCTISGASRMVCVPATATLTPPVQVRTPPGDYQDLVPITLPSEEAVNQDRICYKIKCLSSAGITADSTFVDTFGVRKLSNYRPYFVCGPANSSVCGNGSLDYGEECDDGNKIDGDCCSKNCKFEPTTQACGPDTDANPCTSPRCDGAGACNQSGFDQPTTVPCPDTDGDIICTTPRCDGNGTCDQHGLLATAGTNCSSVLDDGNDCTVSQCDGAGTCNTAVNRPDGSSCGDTDGNACTLPKCSAGTCQQVGGFASASTPCTDTDGNLCTRAACNAGGTCVQDFFVRSCPPAETCNTSTGLCE